MVLLAPLAVLAPLEVLVLLEELEHMYPKVQTAEMVLLLQTVQTITM